MSDSRSPVSRAGSSRGMVVGLDIGGTAIKAGCLDGEGEVERETACPTPARRGPEAVVPAVLCLLQELGAWPASRMTAFGIGCAGLVDPEGGRVRTSPNLPLWKDAPLARLMEEATGCRPVILNDANAFTLAEARLGAARGARNVIGLTLGTGVGGGLLLGGKLWAGSHGFAGEFGHVPLLVDGPLCACGARGCLEALVGTSAIRDRYIRRMEEAAGDARGGGKGREAGANSGAGRAPEAEANTGDERDSDAATPNGRREHHGNLREEEMPLTPQLIARRAREGDPAARWTFEETGRLLGTGMRGMAHAFDPELFVIGGGISGAADLLLPAARLALGDRILFPPDTVPEIRPAALGPAAGWIGAALCALEQAG